MKYVKIDPKTVPNGVRFDTHMRDQGQMVTVSYGGFGRAEHGDGDPYMRISDASDRSEKFYKLAK